jgi:hypothetical protein
MKIFIHDTTQGIYIPFCIVILVLNHGEDKKIDLEKKK